MGNNRKQDDMKQLERELAAGIPQAALDAMSQNNKTWSTGRQPRDNGPENAPQAYRDAVSQSYRTYSTVKPVTGNTGSSRPAVYRPRVGTGYGVQPQAALDAQSQNRRVYPLEERPGRQGRRLRNDALQDGVAQGYRSLRKQWQQLDNQRQGIGEMKSTLNRLRELPPGSGAEGAVPGYAQAVRSAELSYYQGKNRFRREFSQLANGQQALDKFYQEGREVKPYDVEKAYQDVKATVSQKRRKKEELSQMLGFNIDTSGLRPGTDWGQEYEEAAKDLDGWEERLRQVEYDLQTTRRGRNLAQKEQDARNDPAFHRRARRGLLDLENELGDLDASSITGEMSDGELEVYGYYWDKGAGPAKNYLDDLTPSLNYRAGYFEEEDVERFAQNHPILSTVGSVLGKPLDSLGAAGDALSEYAKGLTSEEPYFADSNTESRRRLKQNQLTRETVKEGLPDGVPRAAYDLATAAGDTGVSMAIGAIPGYGPAVNAAVGFGQSTADRAGRGTPTADEVLRYGLGKSGVDYFVNQAFGKKGLGKSSPEKIKGKNVARDALADAGLAFTKGGAKKLASNIYDEISAGDDSKFNRYVQALMDAGVREDDAMLDAWMKFYGWDVLKAGWNQGAMGFGKAGVQSGLSPETPRLRGR